MDRKSKAVDLFSQGFNCSQATFTAYRPEGVMDDTAALRLATVLGAGVACTGKELCGAVSGMLLAMSLADGRDRLEDTAARDRTYDRARRLMAAVEARHGSCRCVDILGLDLSVPGNLEKAREQGLFQTTCLGMVREVCEVVEGMGSDHG